MFFKQYTLYENKLSQQLEDDNPYKNKLIEMETDNNGNEHKQTDTFIKTDGTTGSVHDVWFEIAA